MAEPEVASRSAGRVAVDGDCGSVPSIILSVAYIGVREALANVAEHPSGINVTARLSANRDRHLGLEMLRRSVAEVGGRLRVESRHGRGTRVIAARPFHGVAS